MAADTTHHLLKEAKAYYRAYGRAYLPWRKTRDPYKILVSEVMLQQTQVDRVIPFYNRFIKRFPSAHALAKADLPEVLQLWQGLGYNRRAKMLRDAARMIVENHAGRFPKTAGEIELLSGVGPYTARAIAAFARNQPEVFIETNIRTVFVHHVGFTKSHISDAELLPLVAIALRRSRIEPREFYAMLMDYGSFLKKSGVRLNARSRHYTKQSRFEGSRRQLRGQILKLLLAKSATEQGLTEQTKRKPQEVREELVRLEKEKLIFKKNKKFHIAK